MKTNGKEVDMAWYSDLEDWQISNLKLNDLELDECVGWMRRAFGEMPREDRMLVLGGHVITSYRVNPSDVRVYQLRGNWTRPEEDCDSMVELLSIVMEAYGESGRDECPEAREKLEQCFDEALNEAIERRLKHETSESRLDSVGADINSLPDGNGGYVRRIVLSKDGKQYPGMRVPDDISDELLNIVLEKLNRKDLLM